MNGGGVDGVGGIDTSVLVWCWRLVFTVAAVMTVAVVVVVAGRDDTRIVRRG